MNTLEITRILRINSSPETLFQWISEPKYLQKWFCDVAERNDKRFHFVWNYANGTSSGFDALIVESAPPYRLHYHSDDKIETIFAIIPDGDGSLLKLSETGFSADEAGQALHKTHLEGWDLFFTRLDKALRQALV